MKANFLKILDEFFLERIQDYEMLSFFFNLMTKMMKCLLFILHHFISFKIKEKLNPDKNLLFNQKTQPLKKKKLKT